MLELDALRGELVEIDENLMRAKLTELERALSLKSRKRIYPALHPERAPVTPRRSRADQAGVSSVSPPDRSGDRYKSRTASSPSRRVARPNACRPRARKT
ncbi:MAG: hypothetical protein ABSF69_27625 [Polyangiaceae bacterium]